VHFDPCQPLAVLPDPGITSDQRQAIADGITLWNLAAAAHLSVGDAPASGADPTLPLHYQSAAAPFHGLYDDRVAEVFINDDLSDHARVVTIAHEVGHSFGLVHIPGGVRPSVMNPGNLVNEPTAADVAALASLWGRCP
jgi:Zn-dependent peptidase ImmA (M78 family)